MAAGREGLQTGCAAAAMIGELALSMIKLRFSSLPIGKLWTNKASALPSPSRLDD